MNTVAQVQESEVTVTTEEDFAPGTILAERYRIVGLVGKGGMGTVYLAEHVEVGRKVAIKVLLAEWSGYQPIARRFRVEARTAGALGHPNIVQVFDAGALPDGRLFLAMEHLEGRDLGHEIDAGRKFDARRACVLMRQVAMALGAGHRAGIVHRDVKPSNIMLVPQPDGEVAKVLDFGIAANAAISAGGAERLTDPGSLMGTPEYMAPEQATSAPPGPAFDVYAVGVTLYEMLTGALPFTAAHAFELLTLKMNRPAPSIDRRRPDLPPLLIKLIDDCLRTDPARRPADGDALVARFDEVLADMQRSSMVGRAILPTVLRQTMVPVPAPERRRPWGAIVGAAIAVVAVGGAIAFGLRGEDDVAKPSAAEDVPAVESTQKKTEPPVEPANKPSEPASEPSEPPAGPAKPAEPVKSAEPEVAAVEKPVVRAPAVTRPKSTAPSDEHLTARCQRVRTSAEEARRTQRWSVLRDSSRQRECWASEAEARKLQTKAAMELGDFSGCISAGKGLKDPEVQGWLKLCHKRAGG